MKHEWRRIATALIFALGCILNDATLGAPTARFEGEGVVIDISGSGVNAAICIDAHPGVKISSQLGVTISSAQSPNIWIDEMPKVVVTDDWDFRLPLRINLRAHSVVAGQRLGVSLAACAAQCRLVNAELTIAAAETNPSATTCAKH